AYVTLLPRVQEEAPRPVGEAVRYAMALISEALGNTITYPIRLLKGTFEALVPDRDGEAEP
ncbi:MAG: hypothetical protein N2255_07810, partial [Kiritimatiellae bacterium]|nr:hypothetical protein [Kiritimatiellia bacterium]